ncbi:hypothetical protein LSAT2_012537 [Lamellibrachia satsuma]|nr:hypothetical protein LSAT2_012537 [Lamellibrachia satsuma]
MRHQSFGTEIQNRRVAIERKIEENVVMTSISATSSSWRRGGKTPFERESDISATHKTDVESGTNVWISRLIRTGNT